MPRKPTADPGPTGIEKVPQMAILVSDLVDTRRVPEATLLLQFTYIEAQKPTRIIEGLERRVPSQIGRVYYSSTSNAKTVVKL